jgi:hypothetical protein
MLIKNKGSHMPRNLRDFILIEIERGTLQEPFSISEIRDFQENGRCNVGGGDYDPAFIGTILANHSAGPGERVGETVMRGGEKLFIKHEDRGVYSLNYDI